MRRHGISELEEALGWLDVLEIENITQSVLAERVGLSAGHLSRRLALARRARQEALHKEPKIHVNCLLPRHGKPINEATCDDVHPGGPVKPGSNEYCSVGHEYGREMSLVGLLKEEQAGGKVYDPPKDGLRGGKG